MSYPRGSFAQTCYDYEPWHYRYVGRNLAAQIHASGLTPRQVLWTLQ
jgi:D-alanyl-D-alanine carboxypeptidase